jgi:hypothetical protein
MSKCKSTGCIRCYRENERNVSKNNNLEQIPLIFKDLTLTLSLEEREHKE